MSASHADPDGAIVITGVSVLTPLADDVPSLLTALHARRNAMVEAPDILGAAVSRIEPFVATQYANVRGLRVYNRTMQLGICAAKLALSDAQLDPTDIPSDEFGIVAASTFGHMDTLIEYDRSLMTHGLQRTNPTLMPLAIPSAPGAGAGLSFGAKAFTLTLANGAASSRDALGLGLRFLSDARARVCVVVAAFANCRELILSAARAGALTRPQDVLVFDSRSRGTGLGEASAAIVLERAENARARDVPAKGVLRGHVSTFAPRTCDRSDALKRACEGALRCAGSVPGDIALVSAGANGIPDRDLAEAEGIHAALGKACANAAVIAIKGNLGEVVDAGGLLQVITALESLRSRTAPPIRGLERPVESNLRFVRETAPISATDALVTSMSNTGACSALVVSGGHAF